MMGTKPGGGLELEAGEIGADVTEVDSKKREGQFIWTVEDLRVLRGLEGGRLGVGRRRRSTSELDG